MSNLRKALQKIHPENNLHLSEEVLAYVIKAVERMAPLVQHPEASIQGAALQELRRAQEVERLTK